MRNASDKKTHVMFNIFF